MFKVLHFDDGIITHGSEEYAFTDEVQAHLTTQFATKDFYCESFPIKTNSDFEKLKKLVSEIDIETCDLDLVLIDLRLDLSAPTKYRESGSFEGLEIVKILEQVDPEASKIARAYLTRTVNRDALDRLVGESVTDSIDFLSKRTTMSDEDGWAINEPFPINLVMYIDNLAKERGYW